VISSSRGSALAFKNQRQNQENLKFKVQEVKSDSTHRRPDSNRWTKR